MQMVSDPLHLDARDFRYLFENLGPSLGLWRGSEVAALRQQFYQPPVLDLGCGNGLITSLVLPRVDIGLDLDARALEEARQRGLYTQLVEQPAEHVHLPAGSIQTVVSNSVLEHLDHIDEVLQEVGRMLHPGGQFIFTTPSGAFSSWLIWPSRSYADWRNRHFMHVNLWSLQEWAHHLSQAQLEIELVRPYLRRRLVITWDIVELFEGIWIARRRLVGAIWKSLPPAAMQRIAERASQIDLSSRNVGGGWLIVARKLG